MTRTIEITDEIRSLLLDQQGFTVLLNAVTLHAKYCHRKAIKAKCNSTAFRWANECKIALDLRPGLLEKATAAKTALDAAIREDREQNG